MINGLCKRKKQENASFPRLMPSPTASRRTAGLYARPRSLHSPGRLETLAESDYKGRSALILGKFLTDFSAEELGDFRSEGLR